MRSALFSIAILLFSLGFVAVPAQDAPRAVRRARPPAPDRLELPSGLLEIVPLHHATLVLRWKPKAGDSVTLFVDPVGGVKRFIGRGAPDLVLVTDIHGDHLDPKTLSEVAGKAKAIILPPAAAEKLAGQAELEARLKVLKNGERTEQLGLGIEALPMYNLAPEKQKFHPKGRGNGYVLELGGARVYISGDTADTPEMRALKKIDLAFVCMNLPYTMTAEKAASAVAAFKPRIVYPYHYRGKGENGTQDPHRFEALLAKSAPKTEVRVRDWYPGEDIGLRHPALTNPALATEKAPEKFRVRFETTKGDFVIEVERAWAPNGADRFYNLAKIRYFDELRFFRVIANFMAQFGIHGDPEVNRAWKNASIQDDPVTQSNLRGYVTFAQTRLPNSRGVQFFINFKSNAFLDAQRFAPFGRVVEGMDVVDSLHSGYGEGAPRGRGPSQGRLQAEGNSYLKRDYPDLDYIRRARLVAPQKEKPSANKG